MKTILALTDFSDHAANAVKYAAMIAPQLKARLVLAHAISPEIIELPGNPFVRLPDVRLENYYNDILQHQVALLQLQNKDLEIRTQCSQGAIGTVLNDLIRENQADLVIMGTRGASTFLKKLRGTQTASLIKEAICPVLVIPANSRYHPVKNIAYASDFETRQIPFLKQLLPLAEPLNASLYIFNVKNDDQLDLIADNQILREISKSFPRNNFSFSQLQDQQVVTGIQHFVRDNNIDLLAICVHKPDLLEKLFHTSVTQELAFQSNIPLLALPEKPYHPRPEALTNSTNKHN